MSDAASPSQNLGSDEWDDILHQLEQHLQTREQVSNALKEANAAFAAQYTQPDGYRYMEACGRFTKLLDLKIPMNESEQESVVQILQFACAMHENSVNNPALTEAQRSTHYLASTCLVSLCRSAQEGGVTNSELWCEVFRLTHRAEQALSRATDALDLSKYLDFANTSEDYLINPGNGPDSGKNAAPGPSPVSASSSRPAAPRASLHGIKNVDQTSRSAKLKERASARPKDRPSKGAPLGRFHSMPSLTYITSGSSYSSRTSRAPPEAHSIRGQVLSALEEMEE